MKLTPRSARRASARTERTPSRRARRTLSHSRPSARLRSLSARSARSSSPAWPPRTPPQARRLGRRQPRREAPATPRRRARPTRARAAEAADEPIARCEASPSTQRSAVLRERVSTSPCRHPSRTSLPGCSSGTMPRAGFGMLLAIFIGGAMGALLRLVCPHCGEVQVRGRKPKRSVYACRSCKKRFTRERGEAEAKRRR